MRQYETNKFKKGESLPKEELYELYIVQNKSANLCAKHFGVSRGKVRNSLKEYGFIKPKEMWVQAQENTSLEKYGTTHPRLNTEKNNEMMKQFKQTCIEKYGVDNPRKVEEFNSRAKETTLERYGTLGVVALPEFKEKTKQTCLKRYGVENAAQAEFNKENHRKTNQEKYGCDSYFQTEEFKEKSKETCLENYGVEYSSQSDEVKEKTKQTNLEKFGVEWSLQSKEVREKGRKTWEEKYGTEMYSHTEEMKEKSKQTCREKYGYDFASQSPEFRARVAKTNLERFGVTCNLNSTEGIKKKTETWLKNLGVDHPSKCPEVVEKQWESKKRNGHASTSKTEEYIYQKLVEKYGRVKRNYKSELYPFHCDFYIPIIDTYIEYQGFEGHGKHPFDINNPDDRALVMLWAERADKKKLDRRNKYLAYVVTWIERDPMKREYARINNLKWFEFFTQEEFDEWYK